MTSAAKWADTVHAETTADPIPSKGSHQTATLRAFESAFTIACRSGSFATPKPSFSIVRKAGLMWEKWVGASGERRGGGSHYSLLHCSLLTTPPLTTHHALRTTPLLTTSLLTTDYSLLTTHY